VAGIQISPGAAGRGGRLPADRDRAGAEIFLDETEVERLMVTSGSPPVAEMVALSPHPGPLSGSIARPRVWGRARRALVPQVRMTP
jgi:hypothetical protein